MWTDGEPVVATGPLAVSGDGTRSGRPASVRPLVAGIVERQRALVQDHLIPGLAGAGVAVIDLHEVDGTGRAALRHTFERTIFPTLTPLAVDRGHPFPYISNLCLNLVVRVHHARAGGTRVARVKVPTLLPRFVSLPDGIRVVPVEQVMAAHVGALFPSMAVLETHVFRVTRAALSGPPADRYGPRPGPIGHELHRRRFGDAVRLEVAADIPPDLLELVIAGVGVPESGVFRVTGLVDPGALSALIPADRPGAGSPAEGGSAGPTSPRPPDPSTALPGGGGLRELGGSGVLRAWEGLRALHARLPRWIR